jgi:hypothetical protein
MTQRNRADEGVGAGDVFVKCIEKAGLPGYGFSGQGDNRALQGRKQLPEKRTQLALTRIKNKRLRITGWMSLASKLAV